MTLWDAGLVATAFSWTQRKGFWSPQEGGFLSSISTLWQHHGIIGLCPLGQLGPVLWPLPVHMSHKAWPDRLASYLLLPAPGLHFAAKVGEAAGSAQRPIGLQDVVHRWGVLVMAPACIQRCSNPKWGLKGLPKACGANVDQHKTGASR